MFPIRPTAIKCLPEEKPLLLKKENYKDVTGFSNPKKASMIYLPLDILLLPLVLRVDWQKQEI